MSTSDRVIQVNAKINGKLIKIMVDTGCTKSLINQNLCKKLRIEVEQSNTCYIMRFGNSQRSFVEATARVYIELGKNESFHELLVVSNCPYDLVLGLDYCRANKVDIKCRPEGVEVMAVEQISEVYRDKRVQRTDEKTSYKRSQHSFFLTEGITIPPRSQAVIEVSAEDSKPGPYIVYPDQQSSNKFGYILPVALVQINIDRVGHMIVSNPCDHDIDLKKGTRMCDDDEAELEDLERRMDERIYEELDMYNVEHFGANINPELSNSDKERIVALLNKYEILFHEHIVREAAENIVHKIVLKDPNCSPVNINPYRTPLALESVVEAQIKKLLDKGIIEPSTSCWSSPLLLVKKKALNSDPNAPAQYRMCVDFRSVNRLIKPLGAAFPRINTLLDKLEGSKYFSTLDFTSGFWQIPLSEESREITAFKTARQHYQWVRLPMGLIDSGSVFQKYLSDIFRTQVQDADDTLIYLDDIINHSPDFSEHLEHLEKTFKILKDNNLRLNPAKCYFGYTEIKFLGHLISKEGIKPDPDKIRAVQDCREPIDPKSARSYIGFCSWYRRYIKDFAKIARPLYDLTKDVPFVWTDECQKAFETLKNELIKDPIVKIFDPKLKTKLYTDASIEGLSAILEQETIDEKRHVVEYASRTLNKAEKNYGPTEMECLAVVFGIEHFRHYLLGIQFTVVTDHHALCYLKYGNTQQRRLARWAYELSEYTFDVEYRKGELNHTDYLSRNPVHDVCIKEMPFQRNQSYQDCAIMSSEEISILQKNDKWCNKIRKGINNQTIFQLLDDVLYKRDNKETTDYFVLCTPECMTKFVLKMCHDEHGHFGRDKTLDTVKTRFYWPSMHTDVVEYVRSCLQCQQGKIERKPTYGELQSIEYPSKPFEHINADILGPLARTSSGKTYIIIATDYFSKYVVARALRNITSEAVFLFFEDLFLEHSVPEKITTDNGTQFTAKMIQDLLESFEVQHLRTTFYHAQSNGQVERFNATVCECLRKLCADHHKDWDAMLKYAIFAYNTSIHGTTKESPFKLYKNFLPAIPVDRAVSVIGKHKSQYTESLRANMSKTHDIVRERVLKSHEKQKINFDATHRPAEFDIGMFVWLNRERFTNKELRESKFPLCRKTGSLRLGPYKIIEIQLPNVLLDIEGNQRLVHMSKLSVCHERPEALVSTELENTQTWLKNQASKLQANNQQVDRIETKCNNVQHPYTMRKHVQFNIQGDSETPVAIRAHIAKSTGFIDDSYEDQPNILNRATDGVIGYVTDCDESSYLQQSELSNQEQADQIMNSTPTHGNRILEAMADQEEILDQSAINSRTEEDALHVAESNLASWEHNSSEDEDILPSIEASEEQSVNSSLGNITPDENRTLISPRIETAGARQILQGMINRSDLATEMQVDENIRRSERVRTQRYDGPSRLQKRANFVRI